MTRGIAQDLTGKRFGHLTVIARNGSDAQKNALWLCKCDCGNEASIRSMFLIKRQEYCSSQCRLYAESMRLDLKGKRFGRLVGIKYVRSTKSGKAVWAFRCDCGKTTQKQHDNVVNGHTWSCGCFLEESRIHHGQSQTLTYHRQAHRDWAERNPAKVIANVRKRQAELGLRIPQWLTEADWLGINLLYLEARRLTKETGIQHDVDHIYPIRGKKVSGLHVLNNLQILPHGSNLRKAAKCPDDVCWANGK